MALTIPIIVMVVMIIMQTILPYVVKRTVVFGVSIPDQYVKDEKLLSYKKMYTLWVLLISIIGLVLYLLWALNGNLAEGTQVLTGIGITFGVMLVSMSLYFYFHAKTLQRKRDQKWVEIVKPVKVTDLNVRLQDEMLPWYVFLLPIIITIGVAGYTIYQYPNLPDQIPMHWGPDGKPDSFSAKSPLSAISMLAILFVIQIMFLAIMESTKRSGIKINATNPTASKVRQLTLRKYSSWFMFLISFLITALFSYFQLTTIHPGFFQDAYMMAIPFIFLLLVLIGTIIFAVKVGKADKNNDFPSVSGVSDLEEDEEYWKGGLFYFNKNDPSIFVEKRFGVGWTINFANPIGYLMIFGPIILIILISYFA
ncbi:hypothetical protein AN964_12890 [Heyndrickxia shackletonii]|uniref:DUF1648 domain-containing protein n=1 Tax=Heyndrickxia shackletonii TaxID=157838 RepID=A0A0Q3WYX8_9BACI|nr:DUF5808 domain-containing protein [Heyndrickxia shackletonii]KQL54299.1 hypothetical protein AN964_12890 [Heyndrickxia shackletonii]NEZ01221.1 DUF1648 domain-containing protein [Heyndrickxia shackletonii]